MKYDAFISYSQAADGRLAPQVQRGLEKLAKPWSKRRAMRVFRDETGLSATPDLWDSIVDSLDETRWFVLLASPDAARSVWVNRELEHWLGKSPDAEDRVLIALTDGEFVWKGDGSAMGDQAEVVPQALRDAFDGEPRYIDLRWARSADDLDLRRADFRAAIADLAAPIHGIPKDELESEDIHIHRRTVRLRRAAIGALAAFAVVVGLLALYANSKRIDAVTNAAEALQNAEVATSRASAANALATIDSYPELAVLFAVESLFPDGETSSNASDEAYDVVGIALRGLEAAELRRQPVSFAATSPSVATHPASGLVAVFDAFAEPPAIVVHRAEGPVESTRIEALMHDVERQSQIDMSFGPDGGRLLVHAIADGDATGVLTMYDLVTAQPSWTVDGVEAATTGSVTDIVVASVGGAIAVLDPSSGDVVRQFDATPGFSVVELAVDPVDAYVAAIEIAQSPEVFENESGEFEEIAPTADIVRIRDLATGDLRIEHRNFEPVLGAWVVGEPVYPAAYRFAIVTAFGALTTLNPDLCRGGIGQGGGASCADARPPVFTEESVYEGTGYVDIAASPDGERLALVGDDGVVRLEPLPLGFGNRNEGSVGTSAGRVAWLDAETIVLSNPGRQEVGLFGEGNRPTGSDIVDPSGRVTFPSSEVFEEVVTDTLTGERLWSNEGLDLFAVSRDGTVIAAVERETLDDLLLDAATGAVLERHRLDRQVQRLDHDGSYGLDPPPFGPPDFDQREPGLRSIDMATGISADHGVGSVRSYSASPVSHEVALVADDHDGVAIVDLVTGSIDRLDDLAGASSVAWDPDGARLIVGFSDGSVVVAARDGGERRRYGGLVERVTHLAISGDGRRAVAYDRAGRSIVWNLSSGVAVDRGLTAPGFGYEWSEVISEADGHAFWVPSFDWLRVPDFDLRLACELAYPIAATDFVETTGRAPTACERQLAVE